MKIFKPPNHWSPDAQMLYLILMMAILAPIPAIVVLIIRMILNI